MREFYNMTSAQRKKMGKKGKKHVEKNYNFEAFKKRWIETLDQVHEECGSWETRKNYKSWVLREVA